MSKVSVINIVRVMNSSVHLRCFHNRDAPTRFFRATNLMPRKGTILCKDLKFSGIERLMRTNTNSQSVGEQANMAVAGTCTTLTSRHAKRVSTKNINDPGCVCDNKSCDEFDRRNVWRRIASSIHDLHSIASVKRDPCHTQFKEKSDKKNKTVLANSTLKRIKIILRHRDS